MALKSGRVGIHPSQVDPITGMLIGGGPGGASIDDSSISRDTTWSSHKINSELSGKADNTTVSTMYASINENTASILQLATNKADRSELADVYASINAMALTKLVDVEITDPQDGDYFAYDGINHKWVNSGSAPAPTYIDITCTFYGAVEDIISFTDAAGVSHLVTFATDASSKQETFKIDPSGSSITFTSGVAKNPDNLSESYSKTLTITNATTEIRVMPNNTLYWWGYIDSDAEDCTTVNGWNAPSLSLQAPTHNKNDLYFDGVSGYRTAFGKKTAITTDKVHVVMKTTALQMNVSTNTTKTVGGADDIITQTTTNTVQHLSADNVSNKYIDIQAYTATKGNLYAWWYE